MHTHLIETDVYKRSKPGPGNVISDSSIRLEREGTPGKLVKDRDHNSANSLKNVTYAGSRHTQHMPDKRSGDAHLNLRKAFGM